MKSSWEEEGFFFAKKKQKTLMGWGRSAGSGLTDTLAALRKTLVVLGHANKKSTDQIKKHYFHWTIPVKSPRLIRKDFVDLFPGRFTANITQIN